MTFRLICYKANLNQGNPNATAVYLVVAALAIDR